MLILIDKFQLIPDICLNVLIGKLDEVVYAWFCLVHSRHILTWELTKNGIKIAFGIFFENTSFSMKLTSEANAVFYCISRQYPVVNSSCF